MQKKIEETQLANDNAALCRNLEKTKETALMKQIRNQCVFDYGNNILPDLHKIAEHDLPGWLVKQNEICMVLVHAFLYGAMMGIKHERAKRKEKANKAKGGAF